MFPDLFGITSQHYSVEDSAMTFIEWNVGCISGPHCL